MWLQADSYRGTTSRASSLNRYAYVEGAPETFVDHLGFFRAAAAIQAQKLTALQAAFQSAIDELNKVIASQLRLVGTWSVPQMMAAYNQFHASSDPVVNAAMQEIARDAFIDVAKYKFEYKYEQSQQLARYEALHASVMEQQYRNHMIAAAAAAAAEQRAQEAADNATAHPCGQAEGFWTQYGCEIGDAMWTFGTDAKDMVVGLWDLGGMIIDDGKRFFSSPSDYIDQRKALVEWVWDNPGEAASTVGDALYAGFVAPIATCLENENWGCAAGHAIFDVALIAPIAKGLAAPSTAVRAEAAAADTAAATARTLSTEAKLAEEAAQAARAAEVAQAAEAARLTEAAKVAQAAPSSRLVPGGGLAAHEAAGGHTLARHVEQTVAELVQRLASQPKLKAASTFVTRTQAEELVARAIETNASEITAWLAQSPTASRAFMLGSQSSSTGIKVVQGSVAAQAAFDVRVVLIPDPSASLGYRILTAFPV